MTISDFSIHNVLRTYNKQFRIGKLTGGKKASSVDGKGDVVEISNESKRLAFVRSLSIEIAEELKGKVPREAVEEKVNQKIGSVIEELAKEFSPDDDDFIAKIKDKLKGMF